MGDVSAFLRRYQQAIAYLIFTVAFIVALAGVKYESNARIDDVNRSRAELTYTTCLATNERHDRTIDQLEELIARRKGEIRAELRTADPAQQEVLRARLDALDASRASTGSLIAALAPYENCKQIVLDRFGFIPDISHQRKE